ncbi:amino acid adenylation domain-containing protein [Tumebacillus sp. BK434]|uniref:non-ribosomal peptide synthetase/type I polyketide synthase n=1 Tax=Tumebacillus sp. BK434 TaxID=2512169 RepID=UPI0010E9D209|nr:non-ribosomal peptide synthetase/type I polyketide synthase [Tumebacillus sp. BK434]TCP59316.1 amino acid adenylation domain-containing protein [Tumebacillus sp. BK434]
MDKGLDRVKKRAGLTPEQQRLLEERLRGKTAAAERKPQIPKRQEGGPVPLSFAQRRLWFLDRLEPGNPAYNILNAVRLTGQLDAALVRDSLQAVVERHEALRTVFVTVDGTALQLPAAEAAFHWAETDLTPLPAAAREAEMQRLATLEAGHSFDLSAGPLLRATLLRMGEQEHVLFLMVHHIAADGWSLDLLIREFAVCYEALAAGRVPQLDELPLQYADFAVWQQAQAGQADGERLAYWKQQLGGELPVLELPTDRPRPRVQTYRGALHRFALPQEAIARLEQLGREEGATLYMTLLAAFKTLLYRYTGQTDLLVGSPIAGRSQSETAGMIGVFVNTLVMRSQVEGGQSFRSLLRAVKNTALDAYAHQETPFEALVDELLKTRNTAYSPLFQVMFDLLKNPVAGAQLGGLQLELIRLDLGAAKFDLTFNLLEEAGGVSGTIEYNVDLFDAGTAERFAAHYQVLLQAIAAGPDTALDELPIMAAELDEAVFTAMNDTVRDYELDETLLVPFARQAEGHPDRLALCGAGGAMTYGELHARSNQIAQLLQAQGIGRGDLVGLFMTRQTDLFSALYGILKAGAAYVPIDPDYPVERVRYMAQDSGIKALLTEAAHLPAAQDMLAGTDGLQTLVVLGAADAAAVQPAGNGASSVLTEADVRVQPDAAPDAISQPDDLAYMIYTSGSTGNPKGVRITHRAIVNRLCWHQEQFAAVPDDVVAQRTSVCFDVSVWELFWAHRHGAAVTVIPPATVKDPYALLRHLQDEQVSVIHFVPSLFAMFAGVMKQVEAAKRQLPALRWVITSGEALPAPTVGQWFDLYPQGAKIANLYGPTEAAVDVSCSVLEEKPAGNVLIGKPIANTRLYVLDKAGQRCPVNVKGELYIAGVQLAEGYHNKPEQTAAAFLPNTQEPGGRMYKTGDLARVLPDGNIEYLGRIDSQVKVRGFRIELGEVEQMLARHEAVTAAAVVTRTGPDGNLELAAFYTSEEALAPAALKEFLQARLPAHLLPAHLVLLPRLPLSPNGKIDRRALQQHPVQGAAKPRGRMPETELQQKVAGIWARVLEREQVGLYDNFFDIGGHSLLLVRVHDLLQAELQADVPIVELFQYPTVHLLAEEIGRRSQGAGQTKQRAAHAPQAAEERDIAIVGIGLRLPDADDVYEFWANLTGGLESVREIADEELEAAWFHQDPAARRKLVRSGAFLEDIDQFDAAFFGISAQEARLLDPQHRIFLECAYQAMQNAGYDPRAMPGRVSLYAGASPSQYLPAMYGSSVSEIYQASTANQPRFLPTRVSYKLNLTGESIAVDTACSTSLVAVHLACKSLLGGDTDYALAGGVAISVPQKTGYVYEPNFILSADGHVRAFDKDASGTVPGNGCGVVLLKRLQDAERDGDAIYAVIKGTALNNDGNVKIGYTAPSIGGQAEVIRMAQEAAGVHPESITYLETHGTGTQLGDPMEIRALTEVFAAGTERRQFCALGSVKTNIGHLDTAAGIAGLIKAALAVKHGVIPPSLNYRKENPQIDFANTPFYVNEALAKWETDGSPRRAGVSSFGIGGTNAHVILEQSPERSAPLVKDRSHHLFPLSANSEAAVRQAASNLLRHLEREPAQRLGDLAYTLQTGPVFPHRFALSAGSREQLAAQCAALAEHGAEIAEANLAPGAKTAFLFTGQGSQHSGMGRELYASSDVFRRALDECAALLEGELERGLLDYLFDPAFEQELQETHITQPALFALEYALAQLLFSAGIRPDVLIGHSLGEYVAACLSGALTLADALKLVAARGRMMRDLCPRGAMVSARIGVMNALCALKGLTRVSIAAVNSTSEMVFSGDIAEVETLCARLEQEGTAFKRLPVSHAFHSPLMEPMLEAFEKFASGIEFKPLQIPLISNLNGAKLEGTVLTAAYWVQHLREAVQFEKGLHLLSTTDDIGVLLEVGPHPVLTRLAAKVCRRDQIAVGTLQRGQDDWQALLSQLGELWARGYALDFPALDREYPRRRVHVPTYPFQRKSYWIHTDRLPQTAQLTSAHAEAAVTLTAELTPERRKTFATAAEQQLAQLWEELLGAGDLQRQSDFFRLGGDSLSVIQLQTRLRDRLGIEAEYKDLFAHSTLEAQAAYLDRLQGQGGELVIPSLPERSHYELSFAQQRLWFLHQLEPESTAYHIPAAMKLSGRLDRHALQRALATLVERHESLRTTFATVKERLVQVIAERAEIDLPEIDLQGVADQELELRRLARETAEAPFDLAKAPLLRLRLLKLSGEEHVLLFTVHHIIWDGWSFHIFLRELAELYGANAEGKALALPPLAVRYADYAAWQKQWLAGGVLDEQLTFWKQQLQGDLPVLQLPLDHPRPPVQTTRGETLEFTIPKALSEEIGALSREAGATLYMGLLTAFKALLSRYTGQEDILVGSAVAGRKARAVEDLIGFFVNTVVLRSDLTGRPSYRELLTRVRDVTLDALAHQDVPFERLVDELQPVRSMSHAPLFQVMFDLQNAPTARLELPELAFEPLSIDSGAAMFDLTVNLKEREHGVTGQLEYNADLFERATIERMIGHYLELLAAAAESPDAPLVSLPLLTAEERQQMLVEWNDTRVEFPEDICLHHLFEEQAARTPDLIAAVYGEQELTYRELERRSNQLAHHLQAMGVGPDTPVGVCVERSLELVVALVGVLKAGGAFVPVDTEAPQDRIGQLLEEAQAEVCLTQSHLMSGLPEERSRYVCLDSDWAEIATHPADKPHSAVQPHHLVSIYYTSGSTGKPKGVANEHRGWVNRMIWNQKEHGLQAGETVLQKTTLTFDDSAVEFFWPLMTGGRIALLEPGLHRDPKAILEAAVQTQAVLIQFVPSVLRLFLEAVTPEDEQRLSALRSAVSSGEALRPELWQLFQERLPGRKLYNLCGATEVSIDSTVHLCTADDLHGEIVSIGKPFANNTLYILDANRQPVPVGVIGEIYYGGVGLARGYWNRPDLTEQAFLPNPFEPGTRLYKTGDRAYFRPDGAVQFLGRNDDQVKIRGVRVEPGEVEVVLAAHPSVAHTVVMAREDAPGEKRLVAYVVANAATPPTSGDLRRYLKDKLPEYMVPSIFVLIETMPLTPNGKVDRQALPAPEPDQIDRAAYVKPGTEAEQKVAAIYADVLNAERVGAQDHFFELGGHSLMAAQVIARLHDAFGIRIPLRTLFEAPAVAELAMRIEELQGEEGAQQILLPEIRKAPRNEPVPLSFAQQRLWLLDALLEEGHAYNIPFAIRLEGELDVQALERAVSELIGRHEVLRTSFDVQDGQPVQVIGPALPYALTPQVVGEEEIAGIVQEEEQHLFDLRTGPLVRFRLLQTGRQEHVLLFNIHHIISDGWSSGVMVREVSALYRAFANEALSPLADLPVQYADYAVWQKEWLAAGVLDDQLSYWKQRLGGELTVLQLPTDHPRPARQTHRGATVSFALSEKLTAGLKELSRRHDATLYMTLLAAFQTLLHRWSGQSDIVVGTPVAGRNKRELEELIGFFVNTLVMRTDLSGNPAVGELLSRVRKTALGAFAHQDVPFDSLVEELQPERDMSLSPLFQVMFVLQNTPMPKQELAGVRVSPVQIAPTIAKFDLTLTMEERGRALVGSFEYNSDLFEAATIQRMTGHLLNVLEGFVRQEALTVGDLPLLTAEERQQMLVEWNDARVELPEDICLHHLFEEQVARTPDLIAAVYGEEELTYRELEQRANQLAHHLQAMGVGPDVPVGVCVERSLELVVALVGVLKAGGAFVPVDTEAPQDRIGQLLEEAQAAVCLTQSHLMSGLPSERARYVCLDSDWAEIATHPADKPHSAVQPHHLVSIYYTSGSTGKPKGVANEHRGWVNRMIWNQKEHGLQAGETVLQKTTLTFDDSAVEFFWPLMTGGRIALLEPGLHRDPKAILEAAVQTQAVLIQFVPSVLRLFLEAVTPEDEQRLSALRSAVSSGEALRPELWQLFQERLPGRKLYNLCGATEVSIDSTVHLCTADDLHGEIVSIGKPFANNTLYILDANRQPVPVGVIGEIYYGGVGLARGYWNRPDLTEQAFLPNPFEPGTRLYKTGDRAYFRPDGAVQFLGRNDDQVKIRGVRVEPGEVEVVLAAHPSVAHTVVMAREDAPGEKRLVAYVVADAATPPASGDLRRYLKDKLPEYMVPSVFVLIETMPLTPNGKVDRQALPAPEPDQIDRAAYVEPGTEAEQKVAAIYADVLNAERVGVQDHFFELGGHSLMAAQVIARLHDAFGIRIPLRTLFEAPAVAELAMRIEELHGEEGAQQILLPAIQKAPRNEPLPLSFAQQRMWVIDRVLPGSAAYNIPFALRLQGTVDTAALERTIHEIMSRHEALRTTFREVDGRPVQVIGAAQRQTLPIRDLQSIAPTEREAEALRLIQAEAQTAFDLEKGPLLRFQLLQLSGAEFILLLNFHHIVSDGWSTGVLVQEFQLLYSAFATGEAPQLAELPVQYADYAVWQRDHLQGELLTAQLTYWKQALSGLEPLQLPADRPRPPVLSHRGAKVLFTLPQELTEQVKAWSRTQDVTLYMTLLAAFQTLLHRYSGQEEIAVGTPVAGRSRRELEPLIGFFVNTLVMRTQFAEDVSFAALAGQVRETVLGAFAHQDLPFERLVEELQPERDPSRSPLFQAMFVLNAPLQQAELPELVLTPLEVDNETAKFELTLTLQETAAGMSGSFEYMADLFDAGTIEQMGRHFQTLLHSIVQGGEEEVSRLPLLTVAEAESLLGQHQADVAAELPFATVQSAFEAQVRATPERLAVKLGQHTLAYAELNAAANRLARHLQAHGVQPGDRVALCAERSVELIIAMLAILKSGAAYVPLDVSYPAERLGFMLEDTGAKLLLTQAQLAASLPQHDVEVLPLEQALQASALEDSADLELALSGESLAYVMYTSGSTGQPKGVLTPHRGIVRLVKASDYVQFAAEDVFLQFAPVAFDASTFEIWGALLNGALLVVYPPEQASLQELGQFLQREQVTTLWLTAGLFHQMVEHQLDGLKGIRQLLAGGDALSLPHVQQALKVIDGRLVNGYGPTETTTFACCHVMTKPEEAGQNSVPIGRPIGHTEVYVLDRHLRPVPAGVTGELYIGGAGLAHGYLNRPEQTAQAFVPHPFRTGAKLYKTGDLVRLLPDGTLQFAGRADKQVKIRGFRIEPGEIEAALASHPAVQSALVTVREDEPGQKQLAAYLVAAGESLPDAAVLRSHLEGLLPAYMIPQAWVKLDAIPLTPNGKVDLRALPAPQEAEQLASRRPYLAPRTKTEERLAALCAGLLGVEQVSVEDSFFDLGGHSMLGIQLITRVRQEFGVDLPMRDLFMTPTVAQLAPVIEQLQQAGSPSTAAPKIAARKRQARTIQGDQL